MIILAYILRTIEMRDEFYETRQNATLKFATTGWWFAWVIIPPLLEIRLADIILSKICSNDYTNQPN